MVGYGLHFKTNNRQWKPCYLFHSRLNFKNPKLSNLTQKSPKSLRYPLRANPLKSTFSPLFTHPKISKIMPKHPSNPWKINFLSNSLKNQYFLKKFYQINLIFFHFKNSLNTTKINTFTLHSNHKIYHFIEVMFFTHHFYQSKK